jgi:predicted DNA-binding transcriptional regulator YafY
MNTKQQRLKKIRSFLRSQSDPQTISEVFDALVNRHGEEVSRKTIERDLDELLEAKALALLPGTPSKFKLIALEEVEIPLTLDEARTIILVLGEGSELATKIRSLIHDK